MLALILAIIGLVGLVYAFAKIPEPNSLTRAQSVIVTDRNGQTIGRIHSEADRVSIPFDEMPAVMREAVVATEDRFFYQHKGVRPQSILRAALANVFGDRQGGSTITQQYVKNAFVGSKRTYRRKVTEAVLALKLERKRSKDEILADYLNTIYFGRGAFGVEAAAQGYFGRHARNLTLAQSAFLAGAIRAPSSLDPANDPQAAKGRRDLVLSFMVRDGYITQQQADTAKATPVRVRARASSGVAPHYLEEVRRVVEEEIGTRVYTGGITVQGTLDLDMQRAAREAVAAVYDRSDDPQAALVAIDPKDGSVRAMIGSRSFARMELNIAARARRQPGSTFKAAVLTTYVEEGNEVTDRFDAPASIDIGPGGGRVSNYDRSDHGSLTVEQATWDSVNTVYVQMIRKAGASKVAELAHDMGIKSKLDPVVGLALGVSDVTPLEMTSMFATIAARGERNDPHLVTKVTNKNGDVLFQARPEPDRVVSTRTADVVAKVLQGVIQNGTGARANIGRPAAGKTGTTEDFRDAWFAGFTPHLATVVWNGYPEENRLMKDVRGRDVTGGSFPAEMWARFMREASKDLPPTPFPIPAAPDPSPSPTRTSSPSPTELPTKTPTSTPTVPAPITSQKPSKTQSPTPKKSDSPSPSPSASET